ncbi:TolC family protein [Polaribacter sp. KT 15]|uniref:TolC family protein n=1 Tax=Polaribacter sp. KT 15 TaxID=1896175 RepID=UPI00090C32ED|nr:TolC family protein [Polaribacter sp. KT 15]SHM71742.1 Outer membrane protein TolC [Polaribacter sp. KT 15]
MKKFLLILTMLFFSTNYAQEEISNQLTLSEFLSYVKNYHPIVRQANLVLNSSEAKLLKARGAFDPKIEVDFDKKLFKEKEYYNKLNSSFKIPTWYGVEFKANFEKNDGLFLNPENNVPLDGLYSAGVSVSLAKGLLTNKRMAALKQAKYYVNQAKEEQQILVNKILFDASLSYFNWLKAYKEKLVFTSFLENARIRFEGTKRAFQEGEKPAIDTLEAGITLNSRKLNLEKSAIYYTKASLELSNFLWLNNNTPIELKENIIPDLEAKNSVDKTFNIALFNQEDFDIENHPKIKALDFKVKSLIVEKRLKKNNLLPKIDLQYNFISADGNRINSFNSSNYKAGLNFSFPIFIRKERGDLKLAKIKLQDQQLEAKTAKVTIKNKLNSLLLELDSFDNQNNFTDAIVRDYNVLLKAEERKFFLGESSLFLVNYREEKFIDAQLKAIKLENKFFKTKAKLFKEAVFNINDN